MREIAPGFARKQKGNATVNEVSSLACRFVGCSSLPRRAHTIEHFALDSADSLFAYQLAVVVSDAKALVTDIVYGADLLYSSARQIVAIGA